MKQLPDIVTSVTFWAAVGTLWGAAGAWFTYVAVAVSSRQQTYDGIKSLIAGIEAELGLVSQWAAGDEGNQGYLAKSQDQLSTENPDWFNPTRMAFTFSTPTLTNLTSSPYASALRPIIAPLVILNHSIRRYFESVDLYYSYVMGDMASYQSVLDKMAATPAHQILWTEREAAYRGHIFNLNMAIHQTLIGGAGSSDTMCLYLAFRNARRALQEFKKGLKREPLPRTFWVLHILAGALAINGFWQVLRWFQIL